MFEISAYIKSITLAVLFALVLIPPISANAAYDIKKVGDWKYRAYVCKNAANHTLLLSELIAKANESLRESGEAIEDQEIVKEASIEAEKQIIKNAIGYEKSYPFDRNDAELIAMLTTSIYTGLEGEKHEIPSAQNIIRLGYDVCFGLFDVMDKGLQESLKQ